MLTQARLKELLRYDPETGEFRSVADDHTGRWKAGRLCGSTHGNGYRQSLIDGVSYYHHRLAWLYVHGVWPSEEIDHKNGDRADNKFANLRPANRHQNLQNATTRSDNTSGQTGVCLRPNGKWSARIYSCGKYHGVGVFGTFAAAREAYLEAKSRLHEFQPIPRELIS